MIEDRFLTSSQIQEMLRVSRSTVWRWTTENGLKVVRVGNVTRIRESDLQAFMKRHESVETPANATTNGMASAG